LLRSDAVEGVSCEYLQTEKFITRKNGDGLWQANLKSLPTVLEQTEEDAARNNSPLFQPAAPAVELLRRENWAGCDLVSP
jgi:hypothetical protein